MSGNDSLGKTLAVVVGISLICSIVVSGAAVGLRGMQDHNKKLDKQSNILQVSGVDVAGHSITSLFKQRLEAKIVDLNTGNYVPASQINPQTFDQRKAADDPSMSIKLAQKDDRVGIMRRSNYAKIYLVHDKQGKLERVILPIHGRGLWSMMYAFLAVAPDGNTVKGIIYYEQGETPGLGAQVENPSWRAEFIGKKLYNASYQPALTLVKGRADPSAPSKVDALSGATLTSNGVRNTLKFWLGSLGYSKYLTKLRQGDLNNG
ncbi:Na(+)-translocating NADH-quinone reductase subunit C [Celerinatantimonas yamalensis]|uniref:Na(+)-translocating NADH-quinone reductase subunit C n=1 Tax=Celerinatantimonas yamalensis TaxID=559956 RepID=A0ABW9GAB9_9GAMM